WRQVGSIRLLADRTVLVIDFHYHVVSIVAVFLALAIGIVLGSTELQGTTIDVPRNTSQQIKNQYDATHARNAELNQQVRPEQAARMLGSAILTKSADPNGSTSGSTSGGSSVTSARTVLERYAQAGLLSISGGRPSVPATLAVLVTPSSAPSGGVSDPANQ